MEFNDKKICGDFAVLIDYINGGYIYNINQLIKLSGDIYSISEAKEHIINLKKDNPKFKQLFEKMEMSKELRYVVVSNLHDAVIRSISNNNNSIFISLDISEVKTGFFKNKLLDNFTLIFEGVNNSSIARDLENRTIMNLDIGVSNDGSYKLTLGTYDCTVSSKDIYECVKISINFTDIKLRNEEMGG